MTADLRFDPELMQPARIYFGRGRISKLGEVAASLGRRAFLVVGSRTLKNQGLVERCAKALHEHRIELDELTAIEHEPEVDDVDRAALRMRKLGTANGDFVIGLGGGSAIDLAKAVAAMAVQPKGTSVKDYLEGVGTRAELDNPPLPILAIPTTAGTGSEATKNAVISSYQPPYKKSLRHELLLPRVAVVDPELTLSLPPGATAHGGLDAITQLIESYISSRSKPSTQKLVREAIGPALASIERAVEHGAEPEPREAMARAALHSGIALANSGLGMAHGVAAALGSQFRVSHGLACAVMLPAALNTNRAVAEERLAELAKVSLLAAANAPNDVAADALLRRVESICRSLKIPKRLSELGISAADIPALVEGSQGNSMNGNPRSISRTELTRILEGML